jgi:FtsZ-interacting cell division protein ZipA
MKDLESVLIVVGIIFALIAITVQIHISYKKSKKDE